MLNSLKKTLFLWSLFLFLGFSPLIFLWPEKALWFFGAYALLHWIGCRRRIDPLQEIIRAILLYKEAGSLPPIVLKKRDAKGEYAKIASTLNVLMEQIQWQRDAQREEKKATEAILEALGEGVVALDLKGKITFANRVAIEMLAVSHSHLIGRSLDELSSLRSGLIRQSHLLTSEVLSSFSLQKSTWKSGQESSVQFDLMAAPLTHQMGVLLVLQDKTLESKILSLGKEFVANASHELKTPITVIRGFAEILQEGASFPVEKSQEISAKIVKMCGRLENLVKRLLHLADAENLSRATMEIFDLIELGKETIAYFQTLYPQIKVLLQTKMEKAPILADRYLLDLALLNLLENGVKYSPDAKELCVKIFGKEDRVFLVVEDSGMGISPQDLPHVFNRFYTVDRARSRKSGGAGLGLALVKTVLEGHQGTVGVDSELGKGSSFHFSLPLQKEQF